MRKKDNDSFVLSAVALAELEEIQQKDKNSSLTEIIEKAIELLNAVEILDDMTVPALDTEFYYQVKKVKKNPVFIEK